LVNLDYKLREELRHELRELFKRRNVVAVYATTEANEALALGGVTTLMHKGRVIQSGAVNHVYSKPNRIAAAELFSEPAINVFAGSLSEKSVALDNGVSFRLEHSDELAAGKYSFGVRPHHVSLEPMSNEDVSLDLRIDVAEISGSETYLHMAAESLSLVAQITGVHQFHSDAQVRVYFSPRNLYVFDQQGITVLMPLSLFQASVAVVSEPGEVMPHD
jgi:glycerol transport system ATP-binding protein